LAALDWHAASLVKYIDPLGQISSEVWSLADPASVAGLPPPRGKMEIRKMGKNEIGCGKKESQGEEKEKGLSRGVARGERLKNLQAQLRYQICCQTGPSLL